MAYLLFQIKVLNSKIIFLTPSDSTQVHQFNQNIETFFQKTSILTGWMIEANMKNNFLIFLKSDLNNINNNKTIYYIYFTLNSNSCNDSLQYAHIPIRLDRAIMLKRKHIYQIQIDISLSHVSNQNYHICLGKYNKNNYSQTEMLSFEHQGNASYLTLNTFENSFSIWIKLLLYVIFIMLNSTFNGLNLGLISLSVDELKLLIKTSESELERKYAANILPLREKGNFLLCSILLSITMTSASSVLILDDLMQGFLAGLISTFVLCILGEIIPQALFSKYPLEIGSKTRKLTYFFIYLTCPLSYPLSKIVNYVLGKEIPRVYSRDSIRELIKKSIGLRENQCKIINGALDLKKKYVSDIMISLDKVFMLNQNERLNFETIVSIYNSGFSRIPVYNTHKFNIIGFIHIKDLIRLDANDEIKVKYLMHNVTYCYKTDNLLKIFEIFRRGVSHMAFVVDTENVNNCIGIVTLNDIIETFTKFKFEEIIANEKSKGVEFLKKMINKNEIINNNYYSFINSQTKLVILQVLTSTLNLYSLK